MLWRLLGVNLTDGIDIYGIAVYPVALPCITGLSQGFTHPFGGERLSGIAGEIPHYLRIGHIETLGGFLCFRGKSKIAEQQFHLCRIDLEGFAVSMQLDNLFIIEPIAKPFIQPCLGFAVNGIHRNALGSVYIYCQHFKGQEASASCRVGEEVVAIDRSHETCQVGSLLDMLLVRHTVLHLWAGNEVLQFILVPFVKGFELVVNVDDEVLTDKAQHVLLLWVYLPRIAVIGERGRTEQIKERGLELSLLTCQHKAGMVTTLLVVHRIGDYCHQPFGKVFPPLLGIGYAHAVGKGGDSFRISFRQW